MPRLFTAIELPEALVEQIAELPHDLSGARWVKPTAMHLTLCFIGDVLDGLAEDIEQILEAVSGAPFSLTLTRAGTFPPGARRPPRVLWLGVERAPPLLKLQSDVEAALTSLELPLEDRAYHPHLTLARLKNARPTQVKRYLEGLETRSFPPIPVDHFALIRSELSAQGPSYTTVRTYPLG